MSTKPSVCFANCHMTPHEYGVYSVISSLVHGSGVFYKDDEALANCFSDRKPRAFHDIVTSLAKKGWLECTKPSSRTSSKTFTAGQYRVVSHEEWVTKHGKESCRQIVAVKPMQKTAEAPAAENHVTQCSFSQEPMQKTAESNAENCEYLSKDYISKENQSINPSRPTDGMDDFSRKSAGRENQKFSPRRDVSVLSEAFANVTYRPFKASDDHKDRLSKLMDDLGTPIVVEAVTEFAQDNHDWSQVKSPAGIFLARGGDYLAVAKAKSAAKQKIERAEAYVARATEEGKKIARAERDKHLREIAEEEKRADIFTLGDPAETATAAIA